MAVSVCVCCHSTAKNQLALRSFFALFPFLIFVLVVGNGEIGIPFSVLRNDSLLCITSVKYINKPRCNWIICLHIHRDNCNVEERNAIWKCSSSAPHNHNQVHICKPFFSSIRVRIQCTWKYLTCNRLEMNCLFIHWTTVLPLQHYHIRRQMVHSTQQISLCK